MNINYETEINVTQNKVYWQVDKVYTGSVEIHL